MSIEESRQELDEAIKALYKEALTLTWEERKQRVNALIDGFYNQWGKYPEGYRLEWLANVLLVEELRDRTPDKVRLTEYPILSYRQLMKRQVREISINEEENKNGSVIDYLYQRNVKNRHALYKRRTSETSENK
jgi:hypothetical protein